MSCTVTGETQSIVGAPLDGYFTATYVGREDGIAVGADDVLRFGPSQSSVGPTMVAELQVPGYYDFTFYSCDLDTNNQRIVKSLGRYNVTGDVSLKAILQAQPLGPLPEPTDADVIDGLTAANLGDDGSATLAALRNGFLRMAPKPNGLNQSAALQAILDAGIPLWLHPGTYRANLLVDSDAAIYGSAKDDTVLKSVNGSNKDVIKGRDFDTYTGTVQSQPETKGNHRLTLSRLTIDGNKANNTAGFGIRIWGMGHEWDRITVRNCAQDGIWTEFAYEVSSFAGDSTCLEAQWSHITTRYNNGNGWTCRGPHDSYLTEFTTYGNGGWGFQNAFLANTYDGGIHGGNWNSFLNGTGSYDFGSVFNLGFIIASGASGVGVGVNIRASVSSSKIEHVLGGGHATGLILRGASHQINGSFFNHPTEGIKVDTADTSILNFITRNCGVHVNVVADGGGLRLRGVTAGSGTMLTGTLNGTSGADIYNASTPLFKLPTRTINAGGYKLTFPQSESTLLTEASTSPVSNKTFDVTNTFRKLQVANDVRPTVTGSRGGNAALASLIAALAQLGVINDGTSA